MDKKVLISAFVFLLFTGVLKSQHGYRYAVEFPPAYSWAHHTYMRPLTGKIVPGMQFSLIFNNSFKEAEWLKRYNFPETGLNFVYQNLNHPDLGKIYALFFHYGFFLNKNPKNLQWVFKLGEGLAYNTKPYDKTDNPQNIIFGSHVLYAFYFAFKGRYHFSGFPLILEAGISLYHYSNGSFKTPNSGLNLPAVSLSFIYDDFKHSGNMPDSNKRAFQKEKYWLFFGRFTLNEPDVPGMGKRPAYIIGAEMNWHTSYKHIYYTGFEIMWNKSLKALLDYEVKARLSQGPPPDYRRIGWTFGHRFYLDRTSFITGIGIYVYNPSGKEAPWYIRAGIGYRIWKNFYWTATVKTHFFMAEEVDFGIHYKLNLKK